MGTVLINCLLVGAGGFVGSVARYLLSLLQPAGTGGFPFVTLGINVAGALLIGFLVALAGRAGGIDALGTWASTA